MNGKFHSVVVAVLFWLVNVSFLVGQDFTIRSGNAQCKAFACQFSNGETYLVTCWHCVNQWQPVDVFVGGERVSTCRVLRMVSNGLRIDFALLVGDDGKPIQRERIIDRIRERRFRGPHAERRFHTLVKSVEDLFANAYSVAKILPVEGDKCSFVNGQGDDIDVTIGNVERQTIDFTPPPTHGDSGSPMFNQDGEVIGIVSAYSDRCRDGICTRVGEASNMITIDGIVGSVWDRKR